MYRVLKERVPRFKSIIEVHGELYGLGSDGADMGRVWKYVEGPGVEGWVELSFNTIEWVLD